MRARQFDCQTAPAAADLADRHARLDVQLAYNTGKFGLLGIFQAVLGGMEEGAAVIHPLVEKQAIEIFREIIMMLRLAFGPFDRVLLLSTPTGSPDPAQASLNRVRAQSSAVDGKQKQQIMDGRAIFAGQGTVHIGFGGNQFRVEEQPPGHRPVVQTERDPHRIAAITKFMHRTRSILNFQRAVADKGPQKITE